jgi:CheY-like chemotaxis protein
MTVLIVEDNAGVRRLLRRAVLIIASDVWECEDGAEALEAYGAHRPDIVLMDVRMPRMDGLTATRQIRRIHSRARIVVVTDYDDDDVRSEAQAAGAVGYVLKQDLSELPELLTSIADRGLMAPRDESVKPFEDPRS